MKYLIGLLALTIAVASTSALPKPPKRCLEDEDCYEQRLHPDLPIESHANKRTATDEEKTSFWIESGKEFVSQQQAIKLNKNIAKNVILFLGDGMGVTTIAAARVYAGGEEKQLAFEKFPYTGLSKTYSVDRTVPDSANTATAYLCGIKANYGTLGVNSYVDRTDCVAGKNASSFVYSAAKWAMDAGKAAGFVTTTRVTHASPAGVYSHIAERDWENDAEIKVDCPENSGNEDIAYQLIHGEVGSKLKVMMGGGRSNFVASSIMATGHRTDGKNLIEDFTRQSQRNAYVKTRDELMNLDLKSTDRLLGLFHDTHMLYNLETTPASNQPTLEEMTRKAIEFVQDEEHGYFLFIEGGKIDKGHHDNLALMALDETIEFSKAIELARSMTNQEETLIVVTADHSHAFSFSGYPSRGSPVTGVGQPLADDGLPTLSMSYANGPGFYNYYDTNKKARIDPTSVDKSDPYSMFPATVYKESETHGGDDVPVYASGPWSHLFTGVYEQHTIPHMMAYAACIGDGLKAC